MSEFDAIVDSHAGPQGAPETCMRTHSGVYINLLDPDPLDISIFDIAWHLAQTNRSYGSTETTSTVAEHSLVVSRLVERRVQDNPFIDTKHAALAGLMHDATEAYLGDVNGLLKRTDIFAGYRALEELWARRIEERFHLVYRLDFEAVKKADKDAFEYECAAIRDAKYRKAPDAFDLRCEFVDRFIALGGNPG